MTSPAVIITNDPSGGLPVVTPETALVAPHSGELIHLGDVEKVAGVLDEIRSLEGRLRDAKRVLTDALVMESQRQGSKTLRIGHLEVVVSGGESVTYDQEILMELLDAGLPPERFDALVRTVVEHRVNAREVQRLAASNPVYAEIVGRARVVAPADFRASVKGGSS